MSSALAPLRRVAPGWFQPEQPLSGATVVAGDMAALRGELSSRWTKVVALGVVQLRAALRMLVLLPFTLPAKLAVRWRALFAGPRYDNFLLAEGERIWAWRNRMENERWFWEVFFWDRMLAPMLWGVAYQAIVPNNFAWAVLVPLSFIIWQNGKPPGLLSMELWIIAVFGLYGKCWDQVQWAAAALLKWS